MDKLSKPILAEIEHIEISLENLAEAMSRPLKTVVELAAIGTFLHNIYNGIENILKQTLKQKNIQIAKNENWHKELLNKSVASKIITDELADKLYEYLTFRHFFVHSYGFMLEETPMEPLAASIPAVWLLLLSELKHNNSKSFTT